MKILHLDNSNFGEAILNNEVLLIDFYADWCGPCQALHPVLEKVAAQMAGKASVAKVNVDNSSELAGEFGVRSIPALFFVKKGKIVAKAVGIQNEQNLIHKLNEIITNG